MGADFPLLLQPNCPAKEDAGIADFLRLATEVCSASSAELTLQPLNSKSASTYLLGKPSGAGSVVSLDVGDGFLATLRMGSGKDPCQRVIDVLSASLKVLLDRESLRVQSSILAAALDSHWTSVLLFDTAGNILYANPPADRLLSLQTEDHLLAETEETPPRPIFSLLCSLIEQVASRNEPAGTWQGDIRTADGGVLSGKVNCLSGPGDEPRAVLVLLHSSSTETESGIGDFSELYSLSRREAEVVQLLLDGMTTLAMAERLGISPHTVRDHLKHLYKKTDTNSRSELLGLISRTSRKPLVYENG